MFCPNCGKQNEDSARFCAECGTVFEEVTQQPTEPQVEAEAPVQPQPQAEAPVQPQFQAPQQPQYQMPPQPVYAPAQPVIPGKGLGITSMVLGIIALVLFCVWYISVPCAIVGAALGGVSLSKAKAFGIKNGMATAGIVCSCIALGLAILFILLVAIGVASASASLF